MNPFLHINGEKIWVIETRNNKTGNIRLNIFKTRNEEGLKNYNNIITDGWGGYNFLDSDDVEYDYEVQVHGAGSNGDKGDGRQRPRDQSDDIIETDIGRRDY